MFSKMERRDEKGREEERETEERNIRNLMFEARNKAFFFPPNSHLRPEHRSKIWSKIGRSVPGPKQVLEISQSPETSTRPKELHTRGCEERHCTRCQNGMFYGEEKLIQYIHFLETYREHVLQDCCCDFRVQSMTKGLYCML